MILTALANGHIFWHKRQMKFLLNWNQYQRKSLVVNLNELECNCLEIIHIRLSEITRASLRECSSRMLFIVEIAKQRIR